MSVLKNNRNGNGPASTAVSEPAEAPADRIAAPPPPAENGEPDPPIRFATRADTTPAEGVNKGKMLLLAGGLGIAILFFVFTAVVGRSPKKATPPETPASRAKQQASQAPKESVTPVMDTVHPPAPDNSSGQLEASDIRRTRSLDTAGGMKLPATRPATASSLGNAPSFADTQQKWEDPAPYDAPRAADPPPNQQNGLKEPSLIFVRAQTQAQPSVAPAISSEEDGAPRLELTPGTRIEAKLETQISSAVLAPVVAVVEYTYAIGDRIIIPAGARVYGALQQADRNGLVSVKFDEVELLDGAREKIDAVGTGLDLGPIKGSVYGKDTGKNFLVRAASGIGSVLAEVAGNNTSTAFSEDDMLRERLAENIGTTGDSEVMSLNANSRVVVSVPADTKIYVVFTKHEQTPSTLHKVPNTNQ